MSGYPIWVPRPGEQDLMLDHLYAHKKAAIFSPMGSGKSAVVGSYIADALQNSYTARRVLIVAPPLVAAQTWPADLGKWRHSATLLVKPVLAHHLALKRGSDGVLVPSTPKITRRMILDWPEPIVTVPWHLFFLLTKLMQNYWPYDVVVFDESRFMANHKSDRFLAAKHLSWRVGVENIIELSGGPAANGLPDLWSQLYILDQGKRLGSTLTEFRDTWCMPDKVDRRTGQVFSWMVPEVRRDALFAAVRDICLAVRVRRPVPIVEHDVEVDMPDAAWKTYSALEKAMFVRLPSGAAVPVANAAVLFGKIQQVCAGALYTDATRSFEVIHDAKLDKLEELLDTIGGPIMLLYNYDFEWVRIKARFKHAMHIKEAGAVEQFGRGGVKLLCFHPASAAHGVDGLAQGGYNVVWTSVPIDYDHYSQANARLARPGQSADTVFVHRICIRGAREWELGRDILWAKGAAQQELLKGVTR